MVEVDYLSVKFQNGPGQSHWEQCRGTEVQDAGASTSQSVTTQRLDPGSRDPSFGSPRYRSDPQQLQQRVHRVRAEQSGLSP